MTTEVIKFYSLPPTRKSYHDDQYATTGQGTVLGVSGNFAVFDQSIFYAESGGQVSDQGFVEGRRVVDVQKVGGRHFMLPNNESLMIDTIFSHEFEGPVDLEVGQVVSMEIDWQRRYRNMQMHTLAHFLFHATGEWMDRQGLTRLTKGCYIANESARFDFGGVIPGAAVPEIQDRVIELTKISGRATVTPLEGADDVYIWSAGGVTIPCGGTHVGDSSEIQGEINVRRRSKGKGTTRLYVELDSGAV